MRTRDRQLVLDIPGEFPFSARGVEVARDMLADRKG